MYHLLHVISHHSVLSQFCHSTCDIQVSGRKHEDWQACNTLRAASRCHYQYGRHGSIWGGRTSVYSSDERQSALVWRTAHNQVQTFCNVGCLLCVFWNRSLSSQVCSCRINIDLAMFQCMCIPITVYSLVCPNLSVLKGQGHTFKSKIKMNKGPNTSSPDCKFIIHHAIKNILLISLTQRTRPFCNGMLYFRNNSNEYLQS